MMDPSNMKALIPCMVALTACNFVDHRSGNGPSANAANALVVERRTNGEGAGKPPQVGGILPAKYLRAFTCNFDENPIAAANRYHGTPGGRAERARDLTLLRSFGFGREARDGDLESVGGKIAAPPGLTIFGLPVRSLEINGMIGDANALYVTTFADGVAVAQVVKAARLEMNRASYRKYNIRHYSRLVGSRPYMDLYLDDRGGSNALLTCQVQSTPD